MQASHLQPLRPAQSRWSDARIRYLKQRWSKGASATQIARELGGGLSRNAVLAKLRRLGKDAGDRRRRQRSVGTGARPACAHVLSGHWVPSRPSSARLRTSKSARQERSFPAWIVDAEPYADNPAVDADIPAAQRRPFLALNSQTCRWPVGDPVSPDFFFCGARPLVGRPYCAEHCARAHRVQEVSAAVHARDEPCRTNGTP
jgi:GcrA cell cycle regulator